MKTILIGGIFDLFHCGHLGMFRKAKEFGDYLVVFVASDKEAMQVKGSRRPVIPGKERAELIQACKYVDKVLYSEDIITNKETLDIVKPDIYIQNLGGSSEEDEKACNERGITVVKLPRYVPQSGLDTTKIINKIDESNKLYSKKKK